MCMHTHMSKQIHKSNLDMTGALYSIDAYIPNMIIKVLQLGKPGKGYKGGILFVILLQPHVSLYLNKIVIEYPEALKKLNKRQHTNFLDYITF